jgi:hypothetical protein
MSFFLIFWAVVKIIIDRLEWLRLNPPTLEELKDFTLESYVKLLKYLNQVYTIVPFCRLPNKDIPYLILRHDVDISLSDALKMAQIEKDLDIRSTYFILLSSKFYNVLEDENIEILRQISRLGHEIGLHYHPAQYRLYNRNPEKTLEIEIRLLEHLIGKKIHSIARHGAWDRDPFARIKKYINANHLYFRGDLFLHESGRAWTPLQGLITLLNNPPKRSQLLIHPENWQEDKISRVELLERHCQHLEKKISLLKKKILEYYETDPLIAEYDKMIQEYKIKGLLNIKNESNKRRENKLRRALRYYDNLSRYYLVHTALGWKAHQIRAMIQKMLLKLEAARHGN